MTSQATILNAGANGNQTSTANMIDLEGVEKVYRTARIETVALANVNLSVRAGEFISMTSLREIWTARWATRLWAC